MKSDDEGITARELVVGASLERRGSPIVADDTSSIPDSHLSDVESASRDCRVEMVPTEGERETDRDSKKSLAAVNDGFRVAVGGSGRGSALELEDSLRARPIWEVLAMGVVPFKADRRADLGGGVRRGGVSACCVSILSIQWLNPWQVVD
jgi:hypothetical protein